MSHQDRGWNLILPSEDNPHVTGMEIGGFTRGLDDRHESTIACRIYSRRQFTFNPVARQPSFSL
jgi:hypothetical protein